MITNQEAFTKVVNHLRKQGRQARTPNDGCSYRTPDGLRCAIGCLIPDEIYTDRMENLTVRRLTQCFPEVMDYLPNVTFAGQLQTLHDSCFDYLEEEAKRLANLYKLEIPC